MESRRQQKISNVLLKDLAEIFQQQAHNLFLGGFITVTNVKVTTDLSFAKVYVSIFGDKKHTIFEAIEKNKKETRMILAQRVRHQLRKVPDLRFFLDDSLDYAENINNLLKK